MSLDFGELWQESQQLKVQRLITPHLVVQTEGEARVTVEMAIKKMRALDHRLAQARAVLKELVKGALPDDPFYYAVTLDQGIEAWELVKEARAFLQQKEDSDGE